MEFINDSRSSNLNAAWYALESTSRPVIWIAGGLDSGNDYSMITSLVKRKVKGIVCLGLDVRRLHSAFDHLDIPMADASDMESAVLAAYYMGRTGYQILLSPACPSFDLFTNYEERGEAFRKAVKNI
jgi:UDP-N-acetylmuramoylalanine--D-glutamate ligase